MRGMEQVEDDADSTTVVKRMTMRERTRTMVDIEMDANSEMDSEDIENEESKFKPGSLEDEEEEKVVNNSGLKT